MMTYEERVQEIIGKRGTKNREYFEKHSEEFKHGIVDTYYPVGGYPIRLNFAPPEEVE